MCSAARSDPRPAEPALRLTIAGNAHAIRRSLAIVFEREPMTGLRPDDRGTAEIVLAEILNNIVEHAYAVDDGEIELVVVSDGTGLDCTVIDDGAAMPSGVLPRGELRTVSEIGDLSEGGYGWFLIRSLASDLRYRRFRGRNELRFRLMPEQ